MCAGRAVGRAPVPHGAEHLSHRARALPLDEPASRPAPVIPFHANLRGAAYYADQRPTEAAATLAESGEVARERLEAGMGRSLQTRPGGVYGAREWILEKPTVDVEMRPTGLAAAGASDALAPLMPGEHPMIPGKETLCSCTPPSRR